MRSRLKLHNLVSCNDAAMERKGRRGAKPLITFIVLLPWKSEQANSMTDLQLVLMILDVLDILD